MVNKYIVLICFLSLGLWGCSSEKSVHEITDIREVPPENYMAPLKMTTQERFGLSDSAFPDNHPQIHDLAAHEVPVVETMPSGGAVQLSWEVPTGWQEGEARAMRLATYYPDHPEGSECAVTVLGGTAGGVIANANLWRSQVGLSSLSPEEEKLLERFPMLDGEATYIECVNPQPRSSEHPNAVRVLLGAICPLEKETLFVKLTGPIEALTEQKENLMRFLQSFHMEDTPGS